MGKIQIMHELQNKPRREWLEAGRPKRERLCGGSASFDGARSATTASRRGKRDESCRGCSESCSAAAAAAAAVISSPAAAGKRHPYVPSVRWFLSCLSTFSFLFLLLLYREMNSTHPCVLNNNTIHYFRTCFTHFFSRNWLFRYRISNFSRCSPRNIPTNVIFYLINQRDICYIFALICSKLCSIKPTERHWIVFQHCRVVSSLYTSNKFSER